MCVRGARAWAALVGLLLLIVSAAPAHAVPPGSRATDGPARLLIAIASVGSPRAVPPASGAVQTPAVRVTGPEEVVFRWRENACERFDVPDVPARAFRDAAGRLQLIASHHANRRFVGPDFGRLTRECPIVMASRSDPDPARFSDLEWIHSVYTEDGTTVYALVHNEYQGQTHQGQCPSREYERCWYNAVTLAVSTDGGESFGRRPAPDHLVAAPAYTYSPDAGKVGVFNPSNIVRGPDAYFYALVHVEPYRDQPWGTCLMRTADLSDPASWRAWGGTDFDVRMADPYLSAPSAGISARVCAPVSRDRIQGMVQSLTFNTHFNQYMLVGVAAPYEQEKYQQKVGVFYALSDDLIHWGPRVLIMEAETRATWQCGDPDPIGYPSLIDHASPSRSFETSGRHAYLYFTRSNTTSCQLSADRDLLRIPIAFP